MTVAFNNMPADQLTSLFFAEFNAGVPPYSGTSRQVLFGHKTSGGVMASNSQIPLGSIDPNVLCGPGSTLAAQAAYARRHDPFGEIYLVAVAEPGSAVARVDTLTFTAATAAGTLVRYVAGEAVSIPVAAGDAATAIAARFAAKVAEGYVLFNRRMAFPVVATVSAAVVTLTARHGGTVGNQVRVEAGLDGDEFDPAGVTVTVANTTPGAGEVDLATCFAYLNTQPADWVVSAFEAKTANLNASRDFFADTGTGRWAPTVQKLGHYTSVLAGNLSALTAFGSGRNDPHATVFGAYAFPHPLWCIGAALNGVIARSKNLAASITEAIEISRPFNGLALEGIRPPKLDTDRFGDADRNSLYRNGIAGYTVSADNVVRLERITTTYQRTALGASDRTFLDLETLAQSMYVGRYFRQRIETTYPRHVLMDENPRGLQGVATPDGVKGTLRHAYIELCNGGICEKPGLFAKYVICERSADPNRLNAYLPIDVANQLRVFAANITISTELDENRLVA